MRTVILIVLAPVWLSSPAIADPGSQKASIPSDHLEEFAGGNWRRELEPEIISSEKREYERRLLAMGIDAKVHSCRLMGEIAVGNAGGATATGALCSITIGNKPWRDFWVCENDLGPFAITDAEEYPLSYDTTKQFTVNTCWRF